MRDDLREGNEFPDLRLPEHTGDERSLSELAAGQPLILCFVRGWWCPKEQVRLRMLVSMQDALQREYGQIVVVTVDAPYVNGALRAGLGADFPFLSDEDRRVGRDLDILEVTDRKHLPHLPLTFACDSRRVIRNVWCGFWYWGNPTPEELRQALREITRAEQPTFTPQEVWSADTGSAPAQAGIEGDAVWIREDPDGHEIQRGVHDGAIPAEGDELGKSAVDGRPWIVREIEHADGRVAIHLRKGGEADGSPLVKHHITVPPAGTSA